MKYCIHLLLAVSAMGQSFAQTPAPPVVVVEEKTVVEPAQPRPGVVTQDVVTVAPSVNRLDAAVARR